MVSPNLNRKVENNQAIEINEDTKKLLQIIYAEVSKKDSQDDNVPKIKVSDLISRLSFFYEKVRNAVDYDEEHLLRKNAIARILHRQVVIEGVVKEVNTLEVAEHLLTELIRGSYLVNNQVPEDKITEVGRMLDKYISLKNQVSSQINTELSQKTDANKAKELVNTKNHLARWLLNLAACEIEEHLTPNKVKQTIVNNLFVFLSKNIKIPNDLPNGDDLEIQIYISIARNFLKFDQEMLSFVLFKYYNSDWLEFNAQSELTDQDFKKIAVIAKNINNLQITIDKQLFHPLAKQIDKIVRRYSLYSSILLEAIENEPVKFYGELEKGQKSFVAMITKVCQKKYQFAKKRLWRAAVRSIIYIFLTKSVFVFIIEVPAIKFFGEPLNPVSLLINVCFPAILLFLIVLLIRVPGKDNTEKIVNGIKEIALVGGDKKQPMLLRRPARRNWLKDSLFNLVYTAAFCVSVYFIIQVLNLIHFNWVSITIFLFFLAFVSFFSIMTTKGVKELSVVERKDNIITFLLDLFYMPIIFAGRWLSSNFSRINVFIFLFDFIIEAPFKVLVEIAEDWTKYVRERRENLD